jgi:hypothetical protein
VDTDLLICPTGTRLKMQPLKIGQYYRHCEPSSIPPATHTVIARSEEKKQSTLSSAARWIASLRSQ